MFRLPVFSLALLCAVVALGPTIAAAQEEPVGGVAVAEVATFACRTLAMSPQDTAQLGYLKLLTVPKGKKFLVVWSKLDPTWAKDEDGDETLSLRDEHISLADSKGKEHHVAGTCSRDGRYYESFYSLSAYKEYLGGKKLTFNPVFVVPENEQEFTLKLGDHTHKLTAPSQTVTTIDRAGGATFKITDIKVMDSLKKDRSLREYEDDEIEGVLQQVAAPASKFIAVKIVIKPQVGNDSDGDFYVYSREFGLRYGAQVYVSPIGYLEDDEFYDGYNSAGSEPDAAGEFRAEAMTLVFPLPGKLSNFRVLYLMQDIGGGDIPE